MRYAENLRNDGIQVSGHRLPWDDSRFEHKARPWKFHNHQDETMQNLPCTFFDKRVSGGSDSQAGQQDDSQAESHQQGNVSELGNVAKMKPKRLVEGKFALLTFRRGNGNDSRP